MRGLFFSYLFCPTLQTQIWCTDFFPLPTDYPVLKNVGARQAHEIHHQVMGANLLKQKKFIQEKKKILKTQFLLSMKESQLIIKKRLQPRCPSRFCTSNIAWVSLCAIQKSWLVIYKSPQIWTTLVIIVICVCEREPQTSENLGSNSAREVCERAS